MNAPFPSPQPFFPVDKGVPIPEPQPLFKRKYPFPAMQVGDSFFVPGKTANDMKGPLRYARCACRRFATRRTIENGVSGLRIWRVA